MTWVCKSNLDRPQFCPLLLSKDLTILDLHLSSLKKEILPCVIKVFSRFQARGPRLTLLTLTFTVLWSSLCSLPVPSPHPKPTAVGNLTVCGYPPTGVWPLRPYMLKESLLLPLLPWLLFWVAELLDSISVLHLSREF